MSFAKWCASFALLGMLWAAGSHNKSTDAAIFASALILLIFMPERRK